MFIVCQEKLKIQTTPKFSFEITTKEMKNK